MKNIENTVSEITDEKGNKIKRQGKSVFLILNNGNSYPLGVINFDDRELLVEQSIESKSYKKFQAHPLNVTMMSYATMFDTVLLVDENGVYRIPKDDVLEYGEYPFTQSESKFLLFIYIKRLILERYKIADSI